MRLRAITLTLGSLALLAAAARAQSPFFEASRDQVASAPRAPSAAPAVVRVFVDGCLAHEGDSMKTVDWAINQGFEWVDAHTGDGAALLSGRPGTVLAMAGSAGGVLLAIDLDRRCTVWAERADGSAVRAEFVKALDALAARGARVQPQQERTVERAGAWRHQLQMRVRRSGSTSELNVGAVTTLGPHAAAQVLSAAPAAAGAAGAAGAADAPAGDAKAAPRR
jgi:hypothetical protein